MRICFEVAGSLKAWEFRRKDQLERNKADKMSRGRNASPEYWERRGGVDGTVGNGFEQLRQRPQMSREEAELGQR